MFAEYLNHQAKHAISILQKHNIIQTTCKNFLTKNLKNVKVIYSEKLNGLFPSVIHASDEYHISNAESEKKISLYFLTVCSLRIDGIALNWFFMKMDENVWSMERDTLRDIFIDDDLFIFTEMCHFFKKVHFNNIYCKGIFSKQLGKMLINNLNRKKQTKNGKMKKLNNFHKINNILIFDRTCDLLTPTNTRIDDQITEKKMLNILLRKTDKYMKLNSLLNQYLLLSYLKKDIFMIKREMVYTFGEKVIILFDSIDKLIDLNRNVHLYIPDLCKAVRNKDEKFYNFDLIEKMSEIDNQIIDDRKSQLSRTGCIKNEGENVVLVIGGICEKEIVDLRKNNFTVLTTKVLNDQFLGELKK